MRKTLLAAALGAALSFAGVQGASAQQTVARSAITTSRAYATAYRQPAAPAVSQARPRRRDLLFRGIDLGAVQRERIARVFQERTSREQRRAEIRHILTRDQRRRFDANCAALDRYDAAQRALPSHRDAPDHGRGGYGPGYGYDHGRN